MKTSQRVALIQAAGLSKWGSCRSISSHLSRTYDLLKNDYECRTFFFDEDAVRKDASFHTGSTLASLRKLIEYAPTTMVFMDHNPHPKHILNGLSLSQPDWFNPSLNIVIHIYGDFTINAEAWTQFGDQLKGFKVLLRCASERQKQMLQNFCLNESAVDVFPFPVDTQAFSFDAELRAEVRKRLGIKKDERLWLYSGRISLQKNIHRVIESFSRAAKSNPNISLLLAGSIDDISSPVFRSSLPFGSYFQYLRTVVAGCSESVRSKIRFVGHQDKMTLRGLYNAADVFYSPSMYHDEDFGMAPAEALSSGLACVLTDWGGYSSFNKNGLPVDVLPVCLVGDELAFDAGQALSCLNKRSEIVLENETRAKRAEDFKGHFGFEALSERLRSTLEGSLEIAPFAGFNSDLENLVEHISNIDKEPLQIRSNSFYERLYKSYFAGSEPSFSSMTAGWKEIEKFVIRDPGESDEVFEAVSFSLYPFSADYFNPYPGVFLSQYVDRGESLKGLMSDKILCRDGRFSLAAFFESHPLPFAGPRLLVSYELAGVVPPAWRERVELYALSSARSEAPKEELLLILPLNQMMTTLEDIEAISLKLQPAVAGFKTVRLILCPSESVMGEGMTAFLVDALGILNQNLEIEIQHFFKADDLFLRDDLKGVSFVEFNDKRVVADSFFEHFLRSRGALPLWEDPRKDAAAKVPLSLYHYLEIYPFETDSITERGDFVLENKVLSETWRRFCEHFKQRLF